MPISRVRSVTVTSMMLVTPMPPTTRLIAATVASRAVKVAAVSWLVCRICAELVIRNGEVWFAGTWCRAVSNCVTSACAVSTRSLFAAWTTIWLSAPYPAWVARSVLIGTIAVAFGSENPVLSLLASTPRTTKSTAPSLIV